MILSYYPATGGANARVGGTVSIVSHLTGLESIPPTVTIIYPSVGSIASSSTVRFDLEVYDASGIDSVHTWLDYNMLTSPGIHNASTTPLTSSTIISIYQTDNSGPHTIKFRVFDHAGNYSDTDWFPFYIIDTIDRNAPAVYWIIPTSTSPVVSGLTTLTAAASDEVGIQYGQFSLLTAEDNSFFADLGTSSPPSLSNQLISRNWKTTASNFRYDLYVFSVPPIPPNIESKIIFLSLSLNARYPNGFYTLSTEAFEVTTGSITKSTTATIPIVINNSDTDADGQIDIIDNCTLVDNGPTVKDLGGFVQRDTNSDGYGNVCDADYDNNGLVGASDLNILRGAFGSSLGSPEYNPDVDYEGNGVIGDSDLDFLQSVWHEHPGPSGYTP